MARADLKSVLYSKERSPLQFNFNMLTAPNLYNLISIMDIQQLNYIASSLKFADDIDLKYQMIDRILVPRGFKCYGKGTNRAVYKYLEDNSFLLKVAIDRVGLQDNPREYKNQFLLQPFITKIFQVSPCGTVALVERVQPITSHQEFAALGEDIYDLLVNCIIGKYVLDDIGTKFFMNYGFRNGFGPVLLDYPYVYELDGSKLYCSSKDPYTGLPCCGEIDYDDGFNTLVCTKCHREYTAKDLAQNIKNKLVYLKGRGDMVKIKVIKDGETIIDTTKGQQQSKTIKRVKPSVPKAVIIRQDDNIQQKENVIIKEEKVQPSQPIVKDEVKIESKPSNEEPVKLDENLAELLANQLNNNQLTEENNNQEFTNKVESKEPEEDHKTMKTVYTDTRGYNVGSKFIPEDDEVGGFEKTRKSNRLENNGY